jgi:hypothetical protein
VVIEILKSGFYVSFFCSAIYIGGYSLLAPWWKNPWGRGMVAFSFATWLLLLPTVLHLTFGISFSNGVAAWFYIMVLYLSGAIEIYRLRWAYRVQQHDTPRGNRQDDFNETHRSESEREESW